MRRMVLSRYEIKKTYRDNRAKFKEKTKKLLLTRDEIESALQKEWGSEITDEERKSDKNRKPLIQKYLRSETNEVKMINNYTNLIEKGYADFKDWVDDSPDYLLEKRVNAVLGNISNSVPSEFRRGVGLLEYLSVMTDDILPSYSDYNEVINKHVNNLELEGYTIEHVKDYSGQTCTLRAFKKLGEYYDKITYNIHTNPPKEYLLKGIEWAEKYTIKHSETEEFMGTLNKYDKSIAGILLLMKPSGMVCTSFLGEYLKFEDLYNNNVLKNNKYNIAVRNLTEIERIITPNKEDHNDFMYINTVNYTNVLETLVNKIENDYLKEFIKDMSAINVKLEEDIEGLKLLDKISLAKFNKNIKLIKSYPGNSYRGEYNTPIAEKEKNKRRGLNW